MADERNHFATLSHARQTEIQRLENINAELRRHSARQDGLLRRFTGALRESRQDVDASLDALQRNLDAGDQVDVALRRIMAQNDAISNSGVGGEGEGEDQESAGSASPSAEGEGEDEGTAGAGPATAPHATETFRGFNVEELEALQVLLSLRSSGAEEEE
jgi:hypothetical protein